MLLLGAFEKQVLPGTRVCYYILKLGDPSDVPSNSKQPVDADKSNELDLGESLRPQGGTARWGLLYRL